MILICIVTVIILKQNPSDDDDTPHNVRSGSHTPMVTYIIIYNTVIIVITS